MHGTKRSPHPSVRPS